MKLKGIELKGTYRVGFHDRCFKVYDENDNLIYFENSNGEWAKKEYDEKGDETYHEDSSGNIFDNRVKELTVKEIEEILGYKIKIKGDRK